MENKDAIAKDPTALGAFRDDHHELENLSNAQPVEKNVQYRTEQVAKNMGPDENMEIGEVEEGTESDSTIADPTILGPNRDWKTASSCLFFINGIEIYEYGYIDKEI